MKKVLVFIAGGISLVCIAVLLVELTLWIGPIWIFITLLFVIGGIGGLAICGGFSQE